MNQQISKLIAVQAFCVFTLAPLPRNTLTMPTYPLASKRKFASMKGVAWKKMRIQSCLVKTNESESHWTTTMTEDFYPILFKATTVTCLHTHLLSMAYSGGLDLRQIWNTISYHWANGVRMRKGDCMFPQSNKWNFQWSMSCWSVQSTPIRYYTWKEFNYYYWPQPLNYQLEIVLIEQSLQAKAILTSVRCSHVPSVYIKANTNCLSKQLGVWYTWKPCKLDVIVMSLNNVICCLWWDIGMQTVDPSEEVGS